MVSARFLSQGQKWRGIGRFACDIWADWLHVSTLAVAAPARGHGFGKQLMKRAGLYAVKREQGKGILQNKAHTFQWVMLSLKKLPRPEAAHFQAPMRQRYW